MVFLKTISSLGGCPSYIFLKNNNNKKNPCDLKVKETNETLKWLTFPASGEKKTLII